jgi:hypothetical protein
VNEDERYEISVLADALYEAQQRRDALALSATPADPEKARRAFIEYRLAQAEAIEALNRLERAIVKLGRQGE